MGFVLLTLAWQENLHRIVYSKLNFTVKKLTPQNNVRMVSRGATFEFSKFFSQGRVTIFWAHILKGAEIFGLLTGEGLKFLGSNL